jgi:hypothetical protein
VGKMEIFLNFNAGDTMWFKWLPFQANSVNKNVYISFFSCMFLGPQSYLNNLHFSCNNINKTNICIFWVYLNLGIYLYVRNNSELCPVKKIYICIILMNANFFATYIHSCLDIFPCGPQLHMETNAVQFSSISIT